MEEGQSEGGSGGGLGGGTGGGKNSFVSFFLLFFLWVSFVCGGEEGVVFCVCVSWGGAKGVRKDCGFQVGKNVWAEWV